MSTQGSRTSVEFRDNSAFHAQLKIHGHEANEDYTSSSQRESRSGKKFQYLHNLELKGDGDVWVEILGKSKATGSVSVYFQSRKTGRICKDEPPTGAQTIIWRENQVR
jgi:hypothetical protein